MAATFAAALRRVLTDLRFACGVDVVWKDADPGWWARLPREVSQHRHAHCLAVKTDQVRLGRCIGIDAFDDGDFPTGNRIRTCPFGVTEVLVPVRSGGVYQGCCQIGPWRGARAPTGLARSHGGLPDFPGRERALALGRLVEAAIAPLLYARNADRETEAGRVDGLMAEARQWIDDHLSAGLRVRLVAAVVGLSPSRFVHRFAVGGEPFGGYLRRRLMEEAARRLAAGPVKVWSVASALGFTSHTRFSAAFRRQLGCSPTTFRSRLGA